MLEEMLEEARRQMEESAEPGSGGTASKKPTGWEDLTAGSEPAPEKPIKKRPERKIVKKPAQPVIYDAKARQSIKFQPECMRCNDSMKEITDLGTGQQKGLIYCDSCGEQHKYQIINGELKLKRADAIRKKSRTAPERRYHQVEEKIRKHAKTPAAKPAPEILPAGAMAIPHQMTQADLRTAVVWSEILGKPLGLRDMET